MKRESLMKIYNVHERNLNASPERVGAILDTLSGPDDLLWPGGRWPPMKLDSPLGKGARGGHGPVKYHVSEYAPGKRVVFEFDRSGLVAGFDGHHLFEVIPHGERVGLRHVIDARCDIRTWLKWLLFVQPLHDALLEDALDRAEWSSGSAPSKPKRLGLRATFLRWVIRRGRGGI